MDTKAKSCINECDSNLPDSVKFPSGKGQTFAPQTGWVCPICGNVYAPWVMQCPHCGGGNKDIVISFSNGTGNQNFEKSNTTALFD